MDFTSTVTGELKRLTELSKDRVGCPTWKVILMDGTAHKTLTGGDVGWKIKNTDYRFGRKVSMKIEMNRVVDLTWED